MKLIKYSYFPSLFFFLKQTLVLNNFQNTSMRAYAPHSYSMRECCKQSKTPMRVRALSQKRHMYIYLYIYIYIYIYVEQFQTAHYALRSVCSRVKRVCGYNCTYLCTQHPVPCALYVYIYIDITSSANFWEISGMARKKKSDMVKISGNAYFDMLFQGRRPPWCVKNFICFLT